MPKPSVSGSTAECFQVRWRMVASAPTTSAGTHASQCNCATSGNVCQLGARPVITRKAPVRSRYPVPARKPPITGYGRNCSERLRLDDPIA